MPQRVEFFFDVGSPASYLAWTQLPDLCAQTGAELVIRPMLLGGVFQATGNASPATVPAKGAYTMMDLTRHAKRYGVAFRANPFFPINTLVLMRGAVGVQMHQSERLEAYLAAVFKAIWVDAQDLNQPALVAQTLQAAGFDPAQLLALSGQTDVKNQLRQTTEEAVARGVFGAPTLFVGDGMFFGQYRLDMVREALG